MRFGDLIINEHAGNKNPRKVLMVVHHGKTIKCLTKDGAECSFYNDKDLRLTKVGRVDFGKWFEIAALTLTKED